jgi:spermidine/putrescine transport system substrate-binding protein
MTSPRHYRRQPVSPEAARLLAGLGLTRGQRSAAPWVPGFTRRRFLRNVGLGVGGGALLAACGIGGETEPAPNGEAAPDDDEIGGEFNFANWPFYIDVEEDEETSPTLQQFEDEFGVTVNYLEEINSNDEWFARFRTQLQQGEDIGRDMAVLTDWMAARLINFGWVEEIDEANVPNKANLLPALQEVVFDPGRQRSLTWQSGLTGIGYNPDLTGRELTSINDLFEDDLAGRVTFLTEMRDTMGLVMASMGIDPANHDFSEYEQAIERVQAAADAGQIRAFTGNEYVSDLAAGNIAAALAWSGDIIQLQFDNPDLQFVIPTEGATLWSDNMLIPAGARNKRNAEAFMDFVYRPEIAAQIAAWVNFISPVEGAQEAMEEIDPELAEDELIFPTAQTLENTFEFKVLDEEEEQQYQELFQAVIGA